MFDIRIGRVAVVALAICCVQYAQAQEQVPTPQASPSPEAQPPDEKFTAPKGFHLVPNGYHLESDQTAASPEKKAADERAFLDDSPTENIFGILAGAGVPAYPSGKAVFTYAARIAFQVLNRPEVRSTLGVYVVHANATTAASGATLDQSSTGLMLEYLGREFFRSPIYLGARAGFGFLSADGVSAAGKSSISATTFIFAPVVGVEVKAGPKLRPSLDVSFLSSVATTIDLPDGSKADLSGSGSFLIHAGLTYLW